MKISALIKKLETMRQQYGDHEVFQVLRHNRELAVKDEIRTVIFRDPTEGAKDGPSFSIVSRDNVGR